MDGQLIVVEYNNRKNAFEGERNKHKVLNIENKLDIAQMIEAQLNLIKEGGYVLIKYAGMMYLCERDNTNRKKPYRKHRIEYHPFSDLFSI
jgi:hypothetical protein